MTLQTAHRPQPGLQPPLIAGQRPGHAIRQQDVDDLAMLVNGPVEIGPCASNLQVCLVGKPPVTGSMTARPCSLDELGGEPLHPPVDSDVIGGDAALGQQLLNAPVEQPIPQVPPDRERDPARRPRAAQQTLRPGVHRARHPPDAPRRRHRASRRGADRPAGPQLTLTLDRRLEDIRFVIRTADRTSPASSGAVFQATGAPGFCALPSGCRA